MYILIKLTPLIAFLIKFLPINLSEILLQNFWENFFSLLSPIFDIWRHFWSLDQLVVETVGLSVRPCVTLFLGNRALLFSETLQLWLVQEKFSKRFFENFHRFGQKLSKMVLFGLKWPKREVFCIFSRTAHQNFLILCSKLSLWSRKKMTFLLCQEISKMALFGQNWPKFGQKDEKLRFTILTISLLEKRSEVERLHKTACFF